MVRSSASNVTRVPRKSILQSELAPPVACAGGEPSRSLAARASADFRGARGYNPPMQIPGYAIQQLIGQGGVAAVYLAEQRSLGRQVVLKVLDTRAASLETVERFLNEGRIIASLNHPHIITIFDIGRSSDAVYISMEYVEGGDLKERMQQQVFAPLEALDLIANIAAALAAAHDSGIVHRDVKPGNILFRKDGTPLLGDFGIAKRLDGDPNLTMTGMFVGSPNYMAPEQSEEGPIDGRVDLYALGVIFFEMLTGTRPYQSDSVIDVILQHKQAPVPTLPHGLEQFQDLLNLMMAKARTARFRDAHALIHFVDHLRDIERRRLAALLAAHPDIERTDEHAQAPTPARSGQRLRPLQWLLLGLLMACVAGWAVLLGIERRLAPEVVPRVVAATVPNVTAEPMRVADANTDQIAEALRWLGHHSLDEFRLTDPPRDNAYYYFSRLLQLQPDSVAGRAGLADVAARYALLAGRAIADDHFEQARSYVAIGLQIDGHNQNLLDLRELAAHNSVSFWAALRSLFR